MPICLCSTFSVKVSLVYGTLPILAQVVIVVANKKLLFSFLFTPDSD